MVRVSYRAILHGPMTWKASHPANASNETSPLMVIFEPLSSLAILSQGTLLIPQVSVSLAHVKSQVLSVFVYNDLDTAKSLLSLLYKCLDKNLTVFDLYKDEKALRLLMKSLASFHLPLEFVLKKVDYSASSRFSSRDLSDVPASVHNGLKLSHPTAKPYTFVSSIDVNRNVVTAMPPNSATNNPLQHSLEGTGRNYLNEPKSVKNSSDAIDSYYIRVGLDEGFYMVTSSTDLMQRVFQAIERKGPRVNRLSLNFYKTAVTEANPEGNAQLNAAIIANSKRLVNTKLPPNVQPTTFGANIANVSDLIRHPRRFSGVTNGLALHSQYSVLPKIARRPGYYTPGPATSPLFPGSNRSGTNPGQYSQLYNVCSTVPEDRFQNAHSNFTTKAGKQTDTIGGHLNIPGLVNSHHTYSYSTETNLSNEKTPDRIQTKENPLQTLNSHGLTSMSTNEFYGYISPTVKSNTNNPAPSDTLNTTLLVDDVSDPQNTAFKFSDIKLSDLQLKPYSVEEKQTGVAVDEKTTDKCTCGAKSDPSGYEEYYEDEDGAKTDRDSDYECSDDANDPVPEELHSDGKTFRLTRKKLFSDSYKHILKRMRCFVDVDDPRLDIVLQQCTHCKVVKEGVLEQFTKSSFANVEVVQDHGQYPITVILHPTLCEKVPKEIAKQRQSTGVQLTPAAPNVITKDSDKSTSAMAPKEKESHATPCSDSDDLSEFSVTRSLYKDDVGDSNEKLNESVNASTTEKNTTYREDEQLTSDLDSTNSPRLSSNSDVNVIIDELNELSTKNELLSRDNSKYRNKVAKLKEKLSNVKAIHKYELQQLMNKNSSNEERLRSIINENNITIKMMEQERINLTELVEQQKVTLKRMNREKSDAVQQLSRIEDEHTKLQMVREIDKNEKNNYNKALNDIENLKAENEALANKLRVADEKVKSLTHSEKIQGEVMKELKAKVEKLESDRVKNLNVATENKLMRSRESHLKERLDALNKDFIKTKTELDDAKSTTFKLKQKNMELQDDLSAAKISLAQFESKDDKLESKMSMLEANNTVLLKNLDSSKAELENLRLQYEHVNSDKKQLEERYDQLQSSVEKIESMNQSLSSELSQTNKMLASKTAEIQKLARMLTEQENMILRTTTESDTVKAQRDQVLEEYNSMRDGVEKLQERFKKLKQLTEHRVKNYDLAVAENNDLKRQLLSLNQRTSQIKNELDATQLSHDRVYSRLVARFFMLACDYNKLRRENCINKIKIRMGEYKNNTVLLRVLFRSVAVSKAKVAKRNCQMLKIVEALDMKGPTTASMVLSKISALMETASTKPVKQDKIAQLKSSFMKHSLEKEKQIKLLQTKLVTLEQLKENQQFLLDENRNLNEQIALEQNNSQKLQQALNDQLERERLSFESESKCLYNRQFQLIRDNELLANENASLKQTISSILNPETSNPDGVSNGGLYDVKYARLKHINNSQGLQNDVQSFQLAGHYTMSPGNFPDQQDFAEDEYFNPGQYHQRVVYHRA